MIEPDEQLEEEALEAKPKKRSLARNLGWTVFRSFGIAGMQFVMLIVLARVLDARILGWATALAVIAGIADLVARMGVAPALIQRVEIRHEHLTTAYLSSIASGILQTGIVLAFAPQIAGLFNMPGIEPYLRAISLVFVLTGVARIAGTRLKRDLMFHKTVRAELAAGYAYAIVTIALVMMGFELWGVVIGMILQPLVLAVLLVAAEPMPLPLRFSRQAYRELMTTGHGFTAASVLSYVATQSDNFITGRMLGAEALGIYSRAYQLMSRPAQLLTQSVNLVLFPTMARSQGDKVALRDMFLKATAGIALLVMPTGIVAAILAPEAVTSILGADWEPTVTPFAILAAGMIFRVGNQSSDSLTKAVGDTGARVMPKVWFAVSVVALSIYGAGWGVAGVAWGVFTANLIHTLSMARRSFRIVDIGWFGYFGAHHAAICVSLLSGVSAWATASLLRNGGAHPVVVLLVSLVAALVVGVVVVTAGNRFLIGDVAIRLRSSIVAKLRNKLKKRGVARAE